MEKVRRPRFEHKGLKNFGYIKEFRGSVMKHREEIIPGNSKAIDTKRCASRERNTFRRSYFGKDEKLKQLRLLAEQESSKKSPIALSTKGLIIKLASSPLKEQIGTKELRKYKKQCKVSPTSGKTKIVLTPIDKPILRKELIDREEKSNVKCQNERIEEEKIANKAEDQESEFTRLFYKFSYT